MALFSSWPAYWHRRPANVKVLNAANIPDARAPKQSDSAPWERCGAVARKLRA
jgi:hypothetical protein